MPANCNNNPFTSEGHNLIDYNDCDLEGDLTGNLIGVDPFLDTLQDNRGPTETIALLAGSPAIDAGNPNGCKDGEGKVLTVDQRGEVRPQDGDRNGAQTCDIGAYEFQIDYPYDDYFPFVFR